MKTDCHNQLSFESLKSHGIFADFKGGRTTSDAGGLLLREVDRLHQITQTIAKYLDDPRSPGKIKHEALVLLRQRVYQIALGYEDANDSNEIGHDPVLKVMTGIPALSGKDLGSQPTISRFENQRTKKENQQLQHSFMDLYLSSFSEPPKIIILDIDSTDDPTHGEQQLSFFHGYYDTKMYHPLLVFDGCSGFPLAAILRPGNKHAGHGALPVLARIVKRIRGAFPDTVIVIRGDAGFALPRIYRFCERNRVLYVIGLITNQRLEAKAGVLSARVEELWRESREKQRDFTSFMYRAKSWPCFRRVIAKVERLEKGPNQRFVVTNLGFAPQVIYDYFYTPRGETENRIKELKNHIKGDRLSCHRFEANQFRLLMHTAAYILFWFLRGYLQDTELERAQVNTIRLKLLKIGAVVRQTSRKIWFRMSSSYPYRDLFTQTLMALRAAPA